MRLDHIAYRVANKDEAVHFFCLAFDYSAVDEFKIDFDDGTSARCIALQSPEAFSLHNGPKTHEGYHLAPEIFVSEGDENSVVGKWVKERGGIGGIHHIAYEVDSVKQTMKEWIEKGHAEFTTKEPLKCPGLIQCFTKPNDLTGVIYEFIERDPEAKGFCKENVKDLMESTQPRDFGPNYNEAEKKYFNRDHPGMKKEL